MAINLQKGQTINLDKNTHDLSQMTLGLGWKVRKKQGGFFKKMFSAPEAEFDLDALAFMLDENDKVRNLGVEKVMPNGQKKGLQDGDIIFYNNLRHYTGAVWHTGDERVGGAGSKDDEQIIVRLDSVPEHIHKLLFLVTIYQGRKNNQHFGMVEGAFIRAVDAKGVEIARYDLSNEAGYDNQCSMIFGEVYRNNGGWKFRALGNAHPTDSFIDILKQYL